MLKFILMATALAWTSVSAQITLKGKVLNAETRQPLPGATIQIQNSDIAAVADESGEFVIQNIADKSPVTGLYVTDQSSGLYTNVFTLEPRRFGVAAGVKF